MKKIKVIGGGLAGPEAALQAASFGCEVHLYEMRPHRSTEAHQTSDFAELVCSNSLKSESENSAPWLLKQEMRRAGSFLLEDADATAVPAGHALAVDRELFSQRVRERLEQHPCITIHREEVLTLDETSEDTITILATGPLTSPALTAELTRLTGSGHLAFYDSISPIVDASTIDMSRVYLAARWDKGTADYINCPFTREEYDTFLDALTTAEKIEQKSWEQLPADNNPTHLANNYPTHLADNNPTRLADNNPTHPANNNPTHFAGANPAHPASVTPAPPHARHPERSGEAAESKDLPPIPHPEHRPNPSAATTTESPALTKLQYFEGCLPIEETARRGRDTLRFGPMKPAGLTNPKTGRWPYAVVQLRQENLRADSYNLVGFQNHLKFSTLR